MNYKITDKCRKLLLQELKKCANNQAELARRIGIAPSYLSRYLSGAVNAVHYEIWKKICDYIPQIKAEEQSNGVTFDSMESWTLVPLLTLAEAREMTPRTHPFGDRLSAFVNAQKVGFPNAKAGDFAVQISGTSMLPWYPPGTRVLVERDGIPATGDRVIAMLDDSEKPVFKIFVDLDSHRFALLSINADAGCAPIILEKMSRDWFWVWPIRASLRDEAEIDKAMAAAGIHHAWEKWLSEQKKINN